MSSTTPFVIAFLIVSTSIVFAAGIVILMLGYRNQKRKFKEQLRLDKVRTEFEQTLATAKLEMNELAFRHIGRELHDNVKNMLTVIKLHLNTLKKVDEEDKQKLSDAIEYLGQVIKAVGDLSRSLNTDQITRDGLLNALEREVEILKRKDWFSIDMEVQGERKSLGADRELLIFRIIQESLANTLKHANPKAINVGVHYHDAWLEVEIKDNGEGFEYPAKDDKQHGAGLLNMRERAKVVDGKLAITSAPGKGTTVHLSVPYKSQ